MNAPRAVIAVVAFFIGFGRVSEKYVTATGSQSAGECVRACASSSCRHDMKCSGSGTVTVTTARGTPGGLCGTVTAP
jgi:hypothetical protein